MKFLSNLLPKSARYWVLSGIGVLALMVFAGLMIVETTKAEVTLVDNGEKSTINTHADTVSELLSEASIDYDKHDSLSHDKNASINDDMTITYEAANKIIVAADGDKEKHYTTADTIKDFLDETDISVSKHDDASHKKNASVKDGMEYSIDRGFQVTINDGGDKKKVWTTGKTVGDLLKDKEITLDDADELKQSRDDMVKEDSTVTINRVEKVTDKVKETIDHKVEERQDNSLQKGKTQVIAEGEEGLLVKTIEITKKNGEEVNRDLVDKQVKQESEKRIIARGTKEREQDLRTLSSSDDSSTDSGSGKVLEMTATGYSADCIGCSGVTATGINLNNSPNKKVVAVDPDVIPLGSKVHVEGYGTAIAADTGGAINEKRIDLHKPTRKIANNYGYQTVTVKILD